MESHLVFTSGLDVQAGLGVEHRRLPQRRRIGSSA